MLFDALWRKDQIDDAMKDPGADGALGFETSPHGPPG